MIGFYLLFISAIYFPGNTVSVREYAAFLMKREKGSYFSLALIFLLATGIIVLIVSAFLSVYLSAVSVAQYHASLAQATGILIAFDLFAAAVLVFVMQIRISSIR